VRVGGEVLTFYALLVLLDIPRVRHILVLEQLYCDLHVLSLSEHSNVPLL
jgi:hypothetical protein